MPCNCGKKRKPSPQKQRRPANPNPTPPKEKSGEKQTFILETSSRRKLTYGSRLEAEAANARSGGSGTVYPER